MTWDLFLFSGLIFGIILFLVISRRGIGQILQANEEERFYFHQRRRRRTTLVLLILILIGVFWGTRLTPETGRAAYILCWLSVVFFLCWVILLGILDVFSIRYFYRIQQDQVKTEEALLRYQLRKELSQQAGAAEKPSSDERSDSFTPSQ